MVRGRGIDLGTRSMNVCGLEDGEVNYERVVDTAETARRPEALIEAGFDYVCQIDKAKLFRKRKQRTVLARVLHALLMRVFALLQVLQDLTEISFELLDLFYRELLVVELDHHP